MNKVYCDTNIWYNIAEGKREIPGDVQLCTPITVVEELAITPNQDKDPILVKKAIQAAMSGSIVNEVPPFHYIASLDGYKVSMQEYPNVRGFLEYTKRMANNKITPELFQSTSEYRIAPTLPRLSASGIEGLVARRFQRHSFQSQPRGRTKFPWVQRIPIR